MRTMLLSVIAASLTMAAAPAVAGESSTVVKFADLDLNDPTDYATLEARIADAAKKVCSRSWDSPLSIWTSKETCQADSYKTAMGKIEAMLTEKPAGPVALAD